MVRRILQLGAVMLCGCRLGAPSDFAPGPTQAIEPGTVESLLRRCAIRDDQSVRVEPLAAAREFNAFVVQLRAAEQRHLHHEHDVTIFIHRGRGEVYLDDIRRAAEPGDIFHVPRGTPHWCVDRGEQPLVFIEFYTPPYDGGDTIVVPRAARSYGPVGSTP